MYFPRVPPKLLKLGQVPDVGTRAEATLTPGFAIFWMVVGSNPVWCMNEKMLFFLFSFISSQGKARQQNKTVNNSPKGVQGLWCLFYFFFPSRSLDYSLAPKGFSVLFFAHLPRKRLVSSCFPTTAVQSKAARRFFM